MKYHETMEMPATIMFNLDSTTRLRLEVSGGIDFDVDSNLVPLPRMPGRKVRVRMTHLVRRSDDIETIRKALQNTLEIISDN